MTFDEFIHFVAPTRLKLNIELKESFLGKNEKIREVVEKANIIEDVHFSSFEFSVLQTIHAMNEMSKQLLSAKKILIGIMCCPLKK